MPCDEPQLSLAKITEIYAIRVLLSRKHSYPGSNRGQGPPTQDEEAQEANSSYLGCEVRLLVVSTGDPQILSSKQQRDRQLVTLHRLPRSIESTQIPMPMPMPMPNLEQVALRYGCQLEDGFWSRGSGS